MGNDDCFSSSGHHVGTSAPLSVRARCCRRRGRSRRGRTRSTGRKRRRLPPPLCRTRHCFNFKLEPSFSIPTSTGARVRHFGHAQHRPDDKTGAEEGEPTDDQRRWYGTNTREGEKWNSTLYGLARPSPKILRRRSPKIVHPHHLCTGHSTLLLKNKNTKDQTLNSASFSKS